MSSAIMVMVYNEPVFFPIWLRYYSQFFSPEDIYVLDHQTTDGSLDDGEFVHIEVEHPTNDRIWRTRLFEEHQRQLLERYDVVVCTDVDEIIAPDPSTGTLGQYLDTFEEDFVNCIGYEVLHLRDSEPPFDRGRQVLAQRGSWFRNPGYDKPLIARVPLRWLPGFHHREDGEIKRDPDLRLIHLHRLDFDLALTRHRDQAKRSSGAEDIESGRGYQNRIVERDEFTDWFYRDSCFEDMGVRIELEPIPADWKAVV